ncbi:hypothetical protein E2C01_052692 [Portunus trituberculatus]|uniref:Uncharacterized protein n=1 Tax=Portunus trituberculatus TaxID=210409 RepID=A0A5B7GMJ2_PORTR|nr:hypothetical protein [Portunus trituberculatus]
MKKKSTDGENSPPKLPPLPVPTGDLTGSSATSSYSVLHACLVLGGDVPSCVAQAAAFGQILQNKTQDSQDSLPRPTSEDVTPSSLGTILKIHPFAEVLHSLQDGDLGSQDAVIDKTPLGNVSAGNNVILGFLRNQNVSQDMVEKVISQVNFIKDTFKDSQVLIPWKDSEDKVDISEGSSNNTQGQKNSGDLTENSDNLQQISEDLPKNPDGEKNQETSQITPDLPQINSDPPKLYSSNEALALTDNKDDTPFSSIMLQGELSVKDKENEKKGGDKKDKISEEDKMKEELKKKKEEEKVEKEEEEKEGIKREKTGLTDRRGFLIKSKYPHAQIVPIKPIRLHMRQR